MLLAAAGGPEILDALGIDGEKAHRGAVFRGHIGDRRAIDDRERFGARAEEPTNLPTTLALRSICVTVRRGRSRSPLRGARR